MTKREALNIVNDVLAGNPHPVEGMRKARERLLNSVWDTDTLEGIALLEAVIGDESPRCKGTRRPSETGGWVTEH